MAKNLALLTDATGVAAGSGGAKATSSIYNQSGLCPKKASSSQYALSFHLINTAYQHSFQPTLSTHPLHTSSQQPYQPTHSTPPLNPPTPHLLSIHLLNPPSQPTHSTPPLNPLYQPIFLVSVQLMLTKFGEVEIFKLWAELQLVELRAALMEIKTRQIALSTNHLLMESSEYKLSIKLLGR